MNTHNRQSFVMPLATLLLAATFSSPAPAHHCQGGHADYPGCGSGDGGGQIPLNTIMAGWSSAGASELSGPRNCGPTGAGAPKPDSYHYPCDGNGVVQFNLEGGVLAGRKGSQEWCDNFAAHTYENTTYVVSWSGDCASGNCRLGIVNAAYEAHDVTLANGWPADVGLVVIHAYGPIAAPSSTVNPFIDPQVFDVDEFEVSFNELGSSKKLATCLFSPLAGEVVFATTPVE